MRDVLFRGKNNFNSLINSEDIRDIISEQLDKKRSFLIT